MTNLTEISSVQCVADCDGYRPRSNDSAVVLVYPDYVDVIIFLDQHNQARESLEDCGGNSLGYGTYDEDVFVGKMYYEHAINHLVALDYYPTSTEKNKLYTSFSEFSYDFGGWYRERWVKIPEHQKLSVNDYTIIRSCYPKEND